MKKVVVFPCSVYRGRSGSLGPVDRNALVVGCRLDVGGIGSCGGVGALFFGAYAYRCAAAIGFDGVCSFQLGDNDVVFGAIARAAVMMARPAQVMIARSVATFMVEGIGL